MLIIFMRTILMYLMVLLLLRLMGKAELSNMSPFQMVVIFMIAELASLPLESPDVSLIPGIVSVSTLTLLQIIISFISLKSEKFKRFINGRPSILIDDGKINFKELRRLRITINDLMEQLRLNDAPSISNVAYAIMESNGDLSVIQKYDAKPLNFGDVNSDIISNPSPANALPTVIISDGVRYNDNMERAGLSEYELNTKLSSLNINDISEIFLAFLDSNEELHVYMIDGNKKYAEEICI